MKRVNKTEKNLQKVWSNLDKAYELLENALEDLTHMTDMPQIVKDDIDAIDITAIVCLKNEVEDLIEEVKSR